jgi:hypothetical protein
MVWGASLLSGTCVAAHDTAATWVMHTLTPWPFFDIGDGDSGFAAFLSANVACRSVSRHGRAQKDAVRGQSLVTDTGFRAQSAPRVQ